ncbi:hypothetical protein RRG08_059628 [Elysia crispata]|uniref:Uncharacterized protein n=1 Tax=Elysia crispata TaxID=231223 RepID=A0AAE0YKX7_9GAST|nr:hypothetical protein RRG08_059628 [Elysia crispata]
MLYASLWSFKASRLRSVLGQNEPTKDKMNSQDWLNKQPDWSRALLSDLFLGRRWLMQMGEAAEKFGISIQYSTSYSRHILQSVVIPSVTQARVSSDYRPGNDQSKSGITAMFVDALNLVPSKDTFWSTGNQPGNPYHQDSWNDASP